jgi:hypothetical protein
MRFSVYMHQLSEEEEGRRKGGRNTTFENHSNLAVKPGNTKHLHHLTE